MFMYSSQCIQCASDSTADSSDSTCVKNVAPENGWFEDDLSFVVGFLRPLFQGLESLLASGSCNPSTRIGHKSHRIGEISTNEPPKGGFKVQPIRKVAETW